MASNATAASAAAYELVWGDGVVGTWLLGMTVAFLTLMPLSHALFPKSLKKEGAFLLCFELVAAVPVRAAPQPLPPASPHDNAAPTLHISLPPGVVNANANSPDERPDVSQ
jgi:hypothetical protein